MYVNNRKNRLDGYEGIVLVYCLKVKAPDLLIDTGRSQYLLTNPVLLIE